MNRKVMVEEELKKGWEATSQLRSLLSKIESDSSKSVMNEPNELDKEKLLNFTENYCATIINSFDTCISILKDKQTSSSFKRYTPNSHKSHAMEKVGQNLTLKSKNPRVKVIESPNLVPDCYLWRKYGQKPILHTKHPREYYRCAYKDDQSCRATKHVQKISDNPTKYKIIYYSNHTCQPNLLSNNVAQSKNMLHFHDNDHTNLISFESKIPTFVPKQVVNHVVFNSSPFHVGDVNMSSIMPLAHHGASTSKITAICPSTSNFVDSTTIMEPSLANDSGCHNQADVVYSPNILMSPSYMGSLSVQVEDYTFTASDENKYFKLNGALQSLDLPLWEDDYTNQFS